MGKKILILPDIHGRTFWKEAVDGDFDEIVFLGDYLDHYSFDDVDATSTLKNFQEILEWRNAQKGEAYKKGKLTSGTAETDEIK